MYTSVVNALQFMRVIRRIDANIPAVIVQETSRRCLYCQLLRPTFQCVALHVCLEVPCFAGHNAVILVLKDCALRVQAEDRALEYIERLQGMPSSSSPLTNLSCLARSHMALFQQEFRAEICFQNRPQSSLSLSFHQPRDTSPWQKVDHSDDCCTLRYSMNVFLKAFVTTYKH